MILLEQEMNFRKNRMTVGFKEVEWLALLQELTDYRKKIMQMICSDQEIVDLILDKENSTVPDRSLMYSRVFPYYE